MRVVSALLFTFLTSFVQPAPSHEGVVPCAGRPDGAACQDGNRYTQHDQCQTGVCVGGPVEACPAPDACHSAGLRHPITGACVTPAKLSCAK